MDAQKHPLFTRDFTLVVIGQIVSLFGNAILHFALPLYLLRETGSLTLFGVVNACSFLPMILMGPIGGTAAGRGSTPPSSPPSPSPPTRSSPPSPSAPPSPIRWAASPIPRWSPA